MWVYNYKYPETGLKEFTIKNKEYIINEDGSDCRLYSIESEYNIEYGLYDKGGHWYYIYQPYSDNRLYEWENGIMNYILSFDYEVIYNSWKEALLYKRDRLEKQLNEVEKEVKKLNSGKVIKVENARKYKKCNKI